MHRKAILFALLAVSSTAVASKGTQELDAKVPFGEQRQRIEVALADGKTYSEISREDRSKVGAALARMAEKLGDDGIAANLGEADKVQVFNDQELINTLLTKAREDSRLICRRERPIGSNRPQNLCMTVAQRREARENATNVFREQRRSDVPNATR
ncbi:hypothetical protein OK348_07820 [Flavobacterium sp. MXW15]|uniref:Secreted protein n=1 Tax=Xanthomonas chitinilytica TaxID=2989819 RepID=A0ABT3JTW8_9XANT|nr:hypothetical protein [Xanthomonas sp. H13-6]MCW4454703.1 hypothetical protein [Flavobacterium sp. MXW15]MCW4471942.1 hypothetical protein [Xanthomonas sp. H13-6]